MKKSNNYNKKSLCFYKVGLAMTYRACTHTLHGHVRTCMHIIVNLVKSTRSNNITKEICQKSKIMYIPILMKYHIKRINVEVNSTEKKLEKRAGLCEIVMYYCGFPYPSLMWPVHCINVVSFIYTSTR